MLGRERENVILHRHLKALLHRLGIDDEHPPEEDRWLALLVLLNDRFRQFEEEKHRLQRSLDVHSREVQTLYKELTQERDKLNSALSCVDGSLILLDAHGRSQLMSAESETRLGYSEAEVEGKPVLELLGLEQFLPEGGLARLLQGLRPVRMTVPVQTRSGPEEMEVTLQPLIRDRVLIGCLVLFADPPLEDSLETLLSAEDLVPATTEDLTPAAAAPRVIEAEPEPVLVTVEPTKPPPPVRAARVPSPSAAKAAAAKPPDTPLRILLVEADLQQARDIRAQLEAMRHQCSHHTDAAAALAEYHKHPFDAVMCSEDPKGFPGVELCRKLRQDSRGSYPYFILMTPPQARQHAAKALEAGVDAFLNKPVESGELTVRLKVARGVQSRLHRVHGNLMPAQAAVKPPGG